MLLFRRAFRALVVLAWTLWALFVLLPSWLLTLGHHPTRRRVQHWVFRTWSSAVLWVLDVEVEVRGTPPQHGAFLVANHLSYLDIPVIARYLPPRFVAKAEIRGWPLIGWCCRAVETIFINRASRKDTVRVGAEMRVGIERGDNIVLFPEGTSGPGHGLLPFKPSLLAPAASAELPVHFATVRYETIEPDPPAFLSVSWWGDMPFGPHAYGLIGLRGIRAVIHFGDHPVRDGDRKVLAQQLRAGIEGLFEPMIGFEPKSPEDPTPKHPVQEPSAQGSTNG